MRRVCSFHSECMEGGRVVHRLVNQMLLPTWKLSLNPTVTTTLRLGIKHAFSWGEVTLSAIGEVCYLLENKFLVTSLFFYIHSVKL